MLYATIQEISETGLLNYWQFYHNSEWTGNLCNLFFKKYKNVNRILWAICSLFLNKAMQPSEILSLNWQLAEIQPRKSSAHNTLRTKRIKRAGLGFLVSSCYAKICYFLAVFKRCRIWKSIYSMYEVCPWRLRQSLSSVMNWFYW